MALMPYRSQRELGMSRSLTTISDDVPLQSLTITGNDVSLTGIGSAVSVIPGTLTVTAVDEIFLDNPFYSAHTQTYTAGRRPQILFTQD